MRGLMIDCSRLMERHGYYRELLIQCAEWGYDTLVLHFCDDHGLSAVLPGFEDLAAPNALSTAELRELVALGKQRNIRVIPEIECFGHTRWLADHPRWGACFIGDRSDERLEFNAVDPLHPLTAPLMDALIAAVCGIFTDEIVHIGCDEVKLGDYCAKRGLGDPRDVWSDWVNALIAMVHARGRRAMLWADHLEKEDRIAERIDKRAIVVSWHYGPEDDETPRGMQKLLAAGFTDVIAAPAIQCYATRVHAMQRNLLNVQVMDGHARAVGAMGTLDTIWCPYRHIQGALWHGIAVSALIHRHGRMPDDDGSAVAELLFGGGNAAARRLCRDLQRLECRHIICETLHRGTTPGSGVLADAWSVVHQGEALLAATVDAEVPQHADRLEAMQLAARVAVHLCRLLVSPAVATDPGFQHLQDDLIRSLEADWDLSRFPDDPARQRARWSGNNASHYLLPLVRSLRR